MHVVIASLDGNQEQKNRPFYEVIDMELAKHPQTLLAYEMNGKPLPLEHGAPLRLRVETELGYKMVKYLRSIEFVKDYSHIGEGQGGYRRVDRPEDLGRAWDEALSADRPVIFEACTSGDVPTLPPRISFEQAKHYSSALLKGDPEEGGIIKQSIKSVVEGVLPHKDK